MTFASLASAGYRIAVVCVLIFAESSAATAASPGAVATPTYPISKGTYELHAHHVPNVGWVIQLNDTQAVLRPFAGSAGLMESDFSSAMVNETGYTFANFIAEFTTQLAWSLGETNGIFHGRIVSYKSHLLDGSFQEWPPWAVNAYENGEFASEKERTENGDLYKSAPEFRRLVHNYVFFPYAIGQIRYVERVTQGWLGIFAGDAPNELRIDVSTDEDSFQIRGDTPNVGPALERIARNFGVALVVSDDTNTPWVRDDFEPHDRFAFNQAKVTVKGYVLISGKYPGSEIQIYVSGFKTQDYMTVVSHGSCANPGASAYSGFSSDWTATIPMRVAGLIDHSYAVVIRRHSDGQVIWCADLTTNNLIDWDDN